MPVFFGDENVFLSRLPIFTTTSTTRFCSFRSAPSRLNLETHWRRPKRVLKLICRWTLQSGFDSPPTIHGLPPRLTRPDQHFPGAQNTPFTQNPNSWWRRFHFIQTSDTDRDFRLTWPTPHF